MFSKSGLEGSKANFAYAGSKFGAIGLVQSFAHARYDLAVQHEIDIYFNRMFFWHLDG